jgi:hypothetical protein
MLQENEAILMMESEKVSETDCRSTMTRIVAGEDFIATI